MGGFKDLCELNCLAFNQSLWELNLTNGFHDRPFTHAPSSCTLRTPGGGSEGRHFKSAATSLNYSPDRGKHYRLLCSTLPPGPASFYHPPATLKCWRCEAENIKFLAYCIFAMVYQENKMIFYSTFTYFVQ